MLVRREGEGIVWATWTSVFRQPVAIVRSAMSRCLRWTSQNYNIVCPSFAACPNSGYIHLLRGLIPAEDMGFSLIIYC